MGKRGRKSTGSTPLHAATSGIPRAPSHLDKDAQAIWRATFKLLPPNWVMAAAYPVVAAYCGHVARARRLERKAADLLDGGSTAELERMLKLLDRENRSALALARSLRLTPQAQIFPRGAGRMARDNPGGEEPWNDP